MTDIFSRKPIEVREGIKIFSKAFSINMMVYLIRHAESVPSSTMNFQEGYSLGISSFGRKQAFAVARKLKRSGIKKVFSSPMGRARETAEIICAQLGTACEIEPRVEEHAPSRTLSGKLFKEAKKRTREDRDFVPSDGESFNQSAERFIAALDDATKSDDLAVCVVSHALVMQNALMTLFSLIDPPRLTEGSITVLRYSNASFELVRLNEPCSFFLDMARRIREQLKHIGVLRR